MRPIAFFVPLAATLAVTAAAQAHQPVSTAPADVSVTIGGRLLDEVETLGERDVQIQADELADTVRQVLARRGVLGGARIELILTDLKPNRPTLQQASDRPGLSVIDSISIGGAAVEGQVVTAEGQVLPIKLSRYSNNLRDVYGYSTWHDADRAFDLIARRLADGRLVQR